MLLRITHQDAGTLKLEGRLVQPFIELLERECSELLGVPGAVTLDLSSVTFVDRTGVESLKRLHRRGVVIRGCSDAVASILEAEHIPVERAGVNR